MKRLYITILTLLVMAMQPALAVSGIRLKFNRTGTDASTVAITVIDENGTAIDGATATMTSSHAFKPTGNAITGSIVCPDANANTNPTIVLGFTINGVPSGFTFDKLGLNIHALNGGSNYQEPTDGVVRQWNVTTTVNDAEFGALNDIDIAAGVGSSGAVYKMWDIEGTATKPEGTVTVELTITKGSTNGGCFFGLSEVKLGTAGQEPAPEPEPEPEPDTDGAKVYYIQWKNTGTNYITEESDHRMTVQSNDVTKPQFWMFIPTENEDCYYIKNTATGRYMGSCNLTPSSASKIYTTTEPVEYYVKKTTATSGEIANCWYFSSTDCTNYNKESSGPRALNKDGASDYVITWQAGTSRPGSYWKLIETEDLYEIRPFEASSEIGKIGSSYNVEAISGKNLTITDGNLALAVADSFDENQEWYFVGTGNSTGWQIASAAEPAVVVGLTDGNIVTGEGLTTKWKVNASKENSGYFYFTSKGTTLKVESDSLFRFTRLRSAYARKLQIYNNPCGTTGSVYVKSAKLHGEGALDNIIYTTKSKPSTWHVVYAQDKGEVAQGSTFNFDVTLSNSSTSNITATLHFDWNGDGIFETAVPMSLNGADATAEVTVPEWATKEQTRMRLRINSNGLELAEDDVTGFIHDFHIKVVEAQEARTVTVGVNSQERGNAVLSEVADSYAYGATLTAKATAYGNSTFVCWRQEGVVISTDAEYTFTVDSNVKLVAYFSPNTQKDTPDNVQELATDNSISVAVEGNSIVATGNVTGLDLYTVDAALIANANGNTLDIAGINEGLYIVRATTANAYRNVKIFIKK